jgi:hypothetical protein
VATAPDLSDELPPLPSPDSLDPDGQAILQAFQVHREACADWLDAWRKGEPGPCLAALDEMTDQRVKLAKYRLADLLLAITAEVDARSSTCLHPRDHDGPCPHRARLIEAFAATADRELRAVLNQHLIATAPTTSGAPA